MRPLILLILFLSTTSLIAQTGIGTSTPHASAKLDVSATNKGFLPPRVTLTSATDNTTIASPAEGLLVYNLGSVGLQAGYYYWNGANWATIATATSAGNGVTASDMVKLYSKAYSAATPDSTIANATGYKFTVPVSGRYLFDFSSSGYLNQATMTITFKVRQGTTDLGTDAFTNANNNVHVVFTGMVEVNLQAGVTYNVYVTSTGSRDTGDWDRVFYKLIAGNLPVTGQSVDYVSVNRTTLQTVNTNDNIIFNTIKSGNIPYNSSNGNFTLTAGKTYRLTGSVSLDGSNTSSSEIDVVWKNAAGDELGNRSLILSSNYSTAAAGNGLAEAVYTPSTNTTVSLNVVYATTNAKTVPSTSFATIEQIGSSAIINPWTLSGTNTYNTTGNVGIGNNSPTSTLDVTGTLAVSGATTLKSNVNVGTGIGLEGGEIDLSTAASGNTTLSGNVGIDIYGDKFRIFENGGNARGVNIDLSKAPIGASGDLMWKASGIVNRGVDITLGNLKARIASTGNASLQLSTISGTYSVYGSAIYSQGGTVIGTAIDASSPLSITTTPTYLKSSYNFGTSGATDTWIIMDTSNAIAWRITMILGASVNNNMISIERLF